MATKFWVAKHTGLPSMRPDTPDVTITTADGRDVNRGLRESATIRDWVTAVSDPLAPVGVPVTYRASDGAQATLTRTAPAGCEKGLITGLDGRPIPGLRVHDTEDPRRWTSAASIYDTGAVRWPLRQPYATGSGTMSMWDPTGRDLVEALIRSAQPLLLVDTTGEPGVDPVRMIIIDDERRERHGRPGMLTWDITWTEVPPEDWGRWSGGCPVVTWGEWQHYGATTGPAGWQAWSADVVRQRIAGMP